MADNEADNNERWITINEAVSYFDRSERTIRRWAKISQIRSKKVHGRVYIAVYDTATGDRSDNDSQAPDTSDTAPEIANLQALLTEAQSERDYLRSALAAALSKIPTIAAVASEVDKPSQARRWWHKIF